MVWVYTKTMDKNRFENWMEYSEEVMNNYHEGISGDELKAMLEVEQAEFKERLADDVNHGLLSQHEQLDIYIRHGWELPPSSITGDIDS